MDRIESAAKLREAVPTDEVTGLLGHDYVEARLIDELTVAAPDDPTAFALARLRSLPEITATVGTEAANYVARELVDKIRGLLPDVATLGLTRTDELAVVLPGSTAREAATLLQATIDTIGATFQLPGGADVPIRYAVGIASYPEHAADADGLYMAADNALADAVAGDALLVISI